jgi:hypothetical protein
MQGFSCVLNEELPWNFPRGTEVNLMITGVLAEIRTEHPQTEV